MAIFRRDPPPNGGVECRWGRQESRFPTSIWLSCVLSKLRPARCYQHGAAGPWQVVTLVGGSKWRNLLTAGDDDEVFMTRSLNVTPKTTEQNLIVRTTHSAMSTFKTRSSAVAERPPDASCLYVVSFNIPTHSFFYYPLLQRRIYYKILLNSVLLSPIVPGGVRPNSPDKHP